MEQPQGLVYHTFFAEFRGDTPEDVVQALYADSARVTLFTFPQWWDYQKRLFGPNIWPGFPSIDSPDASRKILDVLVKLGALETGPQPKKQSLPGAAALG